MAIIDNFGTLVVTLDGSGEYAVQLKDNFHIRGEEEESLEKVVSSILRQVGLRLIEQHDGLNPAILERMLREGRNIA